MEKRGLKKVVSVSIPEYTIESKPDYAAVGRKLDEVVEKNFIGNFLVRELSVADHPQYSLDQLADIIAKTGTDKYDLHRKGVSHEEFEPYQPDLQAGSLTVTNRKIVGESFGEDVKRFYENAMLDRGYRLRIDLIVLYDPEQMIQARKMDAMKPSVEAHLEQYLWRFKDSEHKAKALVGIVKILK